MKRTVSECCGAEVERSNVIRFGSNRQYCSKCEMPCSTKTIEVEEKSCTTCLFNNTGSPACLKCDHPFGNWQPIPKSEEVFDYEKWKIEILAKYADKFPNVKLYMTKAYNEVEQFLSSALDELNLRRAK